MAYLTLFAWLFFCAGCGHYLAKFSKLHALNPRRPNRRAACFARLQQWTGLFIRVLRTHARSVFVAPKKSHANAYESVKFVRTPSERSAIWTA